MTQTMKLTAAASAAVLGSSLSAFAGDVVVPEVTPAAPSASPCGDWCKCLKTVGKVYSDKNNSLVQELKFFGRFQWQYANVAGEDFMGVDTDDTFTEIRRFRLGTQVKFLNLFKLKVNANFEQGGPNNHDLGYDSLDEAKLTMQTGDILGLEDTSLTFGRHKFVFGQEVHTSSKKIKTIERSNIANYFYGSARPTGVTFTGNRGNVSATFGVFSTDSDPDFATFGEGYAFYASATVDGQQGDFIFDFLYNDADPSSDVDTFGFEWGASAAYVTQLGAWELVLNAIYGERHDGDAVYGLVIMPSIFLIEDTLEAVFRYQFAGSDDDNLRLTSRYARRTGGTNGSVRGDSNHTLYAGLNWYLCGHNAKFQTGVEYETLDTESPSYGDAEAFTWWFAYRMYF